MITHSLWVNSSSDRPDCNNQPNCLRYKTSPNREENAEGQCAAVMLKFANVVRIVPDKSRCAMKPSFSGSNGIRVEDPRCLYIQCLSTFERQLELTMQAKEPKDRQGQAEFRRRE
jgi:hypothetical protein